MRTVTVGILGTATPDGTGVEGSAFKPIMDGDTCGATDFWFDTSLYWAIGEGSTLWYHRMTSGSTFRQDVSLGTLSNLATPVRCALDEKAELGRVVFVLRIGRAEMGVR